jgi:hypothetical protein
MSSPFPDVPLDATMMKLRVEDTRHKAELSRALRQAGVVRQPWLARRSGYVLCQVGRKLVDVGERLKRYDVPRAMPIQECTRSDV